MQGDVDLWVDGVQIVDHLHLQGVIAHGDEAVFGLHEVDADPGRLVRVHAGLYGFETKQGLGEDVFRREPAQDLVDVADFDLAGWYALGSSAVFDLKALGFGGADILAVSGDFVAKAMVEEGLAHLGEVWRVASQPNSAWRSGPRGWRGVSASTRGIAGFGRRRGATSSTHSPVCFLPRPAKRSKVAKNWSWPFQPAVGTKLRREKESTRRS